MEYSTSDVKRLVKELNVGFIRLQFTDILGVNKNVAIPVEQLDKALAGELMFDGSSIEGFARIEESDMLLRPDPNTFAILPWRPKDAATARLICDIYNPDGSTFAGCPRLTLKRAIARAAEYGYTFNVGPEPEFYLFPGGDNGKPKLETHDQASYFDLSPIDRGELARRDMVITLSEMGFEIEASHHEVGPGQHEIDFKYTDALTTADNIATFRHVVRTIAHSHGLHATFMPKPIHGIAGSGMHTHQSLFKGAENVFYDPQGPGELSSAARHYLGGIMARASEFCAITSPLVNSYKRLVPGYEAPVYIAWSERNRSPLVRVPARRGIGTRLEVRNPDPSCNPYLALAVMLQAGLDGIEHEIEPPEPVNVNIYHLTPAERAELGIENLPGTLNEAVQNMKASTFMREALGQHIFDRFIEAKELEWSIYSSQIHQWEVDQYLSTF